MRSSQLPGEDARTARQPNDADTHTTTITLITLVGQGRHLGNGICLRNLPPPSRLDFHAGVSVSNTAAAAGKAGDVQLQQQSVRDKQAAEYSALTDTRQCYYRRTSFPCDFTSMAVDYR